MRNFFLGILLALLPLSSAFALNIDEKVNQALIPYTQALASFVFYPITLFGAKLPLVVLWLVFAAVFFTLYFKFVNLRYLKLSINIVRGVYANPKDPGEVSHFQALATAVSGTVGMGNIAGVAVAITLGGPGATFWMVLAGLLGMSTKFIECALAVKYRDENPDGTVSGGPMYTLGKGLLRFSKKGAKFLAGFYALGMMIGCFGIGNMFQSNQAFLQIVQVTGGENHSWFADKGCLVGLVLAFFVGLVIIGGIKRIARVTEKLVPLMALLYVIFCLIIIGMNYDDIPIALKMIFLQAFHAPSVLGGAVGAMMIGFQRAAFSNEAGIGSAAIAHSAVRTKEPITEGLVALLEPFIDTIVICTISALVIVTTVYVHPQHYQGLGGIALTSAVFQENIHWSPYVLTLVAILFAYSTMLAWAYYGLKAWTYLVGEGKKKELFYKFIFCCFVILGAMLKLEAVLQFSDALIFIISVPNIVGLYVMAPQIKTDLESFLARVIRQHGEN